ncbi:MAG: ABC transporter ATP-binding protein, partial [Myxococcales bacterium]
RGGRIELEERNLVAEKSHAIVARGVALVPEGRLVFAPFTVEDNLRLGAIRLRGGLQERYDYVYRLFPRLAERRQQIAGTLSGGEQQMLAIGRALLSRPKVMLLDEPSMGLAPVIVQEVFRTIQRLKQEGMTMLLVEQFAKTALAVADYVYVMERGRIALEGKPEELRRDERMLAAYLG